MRRLLLAFVALALLAMPAAAATTATHTIRITRTGFTPVRQTINLGDRVVWMNADTINHQVVADNGAFASPILAPGRSYGFTFRECCAYPYHDALRPSLKGRITVQGPPPSLSLALSVPILRFGDTLTVSVQTSSRRAGETVTVNATPFGGSAQTVATLTTGESGIASFTTQPPLQTTYQARWGSRSSQLVVAQIRPKLTLLPSGGRLHARVMAGRSFAGRSIYLQRLSAFGQWVSVARFTLGPLSGRIFNRPRTAGTYHVYIPTTQVGEGYLDGWSGTQKFKARK